jgi:hypothetical protein
MNGRFALAAVSTLLLSLLACGKGAPSAARKATREQLFASAINAHLAQHPKCIGEPAITFPAQVPTAPFIMGLSADYRAKVERLETLVRLGLVTMHVEREGTDQQENVYDLTSAGRAVHRQFPPGRWDPSKPVAAFCYGTAVADSIVRFTEPAEGLGQVTTEVTYTYRLAHVAPWAEDAGLRRAYPYLEEELATSSAPREATLVLVQASDGWRVVATP